MKKGGSGGGGGGAPRGDTIRRCFLARHELHPPCFLHRLYIFHLQVINGILRETVSVPPLNRINVAIVNKDLCQSVLTGCGGIQSC